MMGKTKTVEFLINKGANIEAKRNDGSTSLHEGIKILLNITILKNYRLNILSINLGQKRNC